MVTVSTAGTAVGSSSKPIYVNSSGVATACSSTVGSSTKPVYMSSGTITACSSTVGGTAKPIYQSSGTLTACSSTVGNYYTPVYMSTGTITTCSYPIPFYSIITVTFSGTIAALTTMTLSASFTDGVIVGHSIIWFIGPTSWCTVSEVTTGSDSGSVTASVTNIGSSSHTCKGRIYGLTINADIVSTSIAGTLS